MRGPDLRPRKRRPSLPLEAIWKRAKVTERGCWEWTGARTAPGYGRLQRRATALWAHRVAWELTHGPIPAGLFVLHHCDNPPCINPAHLFLGTRLDNARDAVQKGRMRGHCRREIGR